MEIHENSSAKNNEEREEEIEVTHQTGFHSTFVRYGSGYYTEALVVAQPPKSKVNGCSGYTTVSSYNDDCKALLPTSLINEINNYAPIVNRIINETMTGNFKGSTWLELSNFVDKFGSRFTGTQNLEDSIDYMLNKSMKLGLENVHGEMATVPRWVRGHESVTLLRPRIKDIKMLGLGYSVGTPPEGITADAIVVKSFEELKKRAAEVAGKIVVYNEKFESYGLTVKYRSLGAVKAAKFGAVATLIRSITPFSLYTPHTGMMDYSENVTKIPAACITIEDASLLSRMAARGERISLKIIMQAEMLADVKSRNIVSEIIGSKKPNKVVVVSGHIDSWDVGQGAMDDGGGAFVSWNSVVLLKRLDLRPKRTIRSIMWTGEEMGIIGANQYIKEHKNEQRDLQFVMESDMGTFKPLGLKYDGTLQVRCVLEKILKLLEPLGTNALKSPGEGPDIGAWIDAGVPGASLWTQNDRYFWYHHSEADTMNVENPESLDMSTALFSAVSYVLADISLDLLHG